MDLIEVEEGTTRFFIPRQDSSSPFPPGSAPVFYNRRMELNRDGTVLFVTVLKPSGTSMLWGQLVSGVFGSPQNVASG